MHGLGERELFLQAALHERGMADEELVGDHERQRFAGTSAVPEPSDGNGPGGRDRTSAYEEGRRSADDPSRVGQFREGRNAERSKR